MIKYFHQKLMKMNFKFYHLEKKIDKKTLYYCGELTEV